MQNISSQGEASKPEESEEQSTLQQSSGSPTDRYTSEESSESNQPITQESGYTENNPQSQYQGRHISDRKE